MRIALARSLERLGLGARFNRIRRPARIFVLRRTSPVSERYGWDRGKLIDRFYIEQFLEENRSAIRGRVLEVADANYTTRFGTAVEQSDVLDIRSRNPLATFVEDLTIASGIPNATFDCFILTQTLQLIYDLRAAVKQVHRILKPGGVALATVPAIQRIGRTHLDRDYWRFTPASAAALFEEFFGSDAVTVVPYGNLLTSIAFFRGMSVNELPRRKVAITDPFFATTIAVRAQRAAEQPHH
jgi:SAM-dependent methyltransferase